MVISFFFHICNIHAIQCKKSWEPNIAHQQVNLVEKCAVTLVTADRELMETKQMLSQNCVPAGPTESSCISMNGEIISKTRL